MRKLLAPLIALLTFSQPAHPVGVTGFELLSMCANGNPGCKGYLEGYFEAMSQVGNAYTGICLSESASLDLLLYHYMGFLDTHQALGPMPASMSVWVMLVDEYKCPTAKGAPHP